MAPAGTPKAIVDKLNAEINKVLDTADMKEAWAKQGAVPIVMTPAEFDAYLRADIEKWAKVIQTAGIKLRNEQGDGRNNPAARQRRRARRRRPMPDTSLLSVLRGTLGLTGTHFGCGADQCGACNVLMDGQAVAACDTPLWAVAGKDVTTVEGLGTPEQPAPAAAAPSSPSRPCSAATASPAS